MSSISLCPSDSKPMWDLYVSPLNKKQYFNLKQEQLKLANSNQTIILLREYLILYLFIYIYIRTFKNSLGCILWLPLCFKFQSPSFHARLCGLKTLWFQLLVLALKVFFGKCSRRKWTILIQLQRNTKYVYSNSKCAR